MNLPDPNFLPAPLWLITTLHVLTLSLHFAAMNFVLGGVILVLTGRLGRNGENPALRRFITLLPSAMAATVTLGIAPLLFLQLAYPLQVYPAAIVSGWFWFLVIPAAILAYYFLYAASFSATKTASAWMRYLWPALLGLLYVSVVYSSVFSMAERPDLVRELYSRGQGGLRWNPQTGDYLLRWLHMILGAVAVAGFFAALLDKENARTSAMAKKTFAYGMAAAIVSGVTYLLSLNGSLSALMRAPAAWALAAGILLSLLALHFFFRRHLVRAGSALAASLFLMVLTRHQLRLIRLEGYFDPAAWRIAPQWGPLFLFLLFLAIAAVVLIVMLRLFFRARAA